MEGNVEGKVRFEAITKILARIIARRDSEMFREAVPYVEMGLTDYLDVVKVPMDLGTVRAKLEGKTYQTEDECAEDIRRIWRNAMLYNAPGAVVYVKAKTLSEFFEAQWSAFCEQDKNRAPQQTELQEFADKCYKINPDALGKVLKMLEKDSPACLVKKPQSNEVEVNVDLIKGSVFRQVDAFVQSFIDGN